jgi:mRNA-degrading endonuclease HigB of HigAB toxin-antitoxin module
MAVDVNKLIADAKKAQAAATKTAKKSAADALKDKAMAEVTAQSKKQLEYADTLKPTIAQYEAELQIWANKIAKGDKLSPIEQKDFNKLVKDYNSVNSTVNAAIKKANDIIVEARRGKPATDTSTAPSEKDTAFFTNIKKGQYGEINGKWLDWQGNPATGTLIIDGKSVNVKNGIEAKAPTRVASSTSSAPNKITAPAGLTPEKAAPITPATNIAPATPLEAARESGKFQGGQTATPATTGNNADTAIAKAIELYGMPDIIFNNVPSLKNILTRYINSEINLDTFVKEVANDTWYRQNSAEIKARYLQKFNYDDLVKTGKATGNTDYEQKIASITRTVMDQAKSQGSALDETQAKLIAEDLYIHNMESDTAALTKRLATSIRPVALGGNLGTGYTGKALSDLQTLQGIAKANGLKLANIVPNRLGVNATPDQIQNDVLAGLQDGSIDVNRLTQNARILASQGQPQYVRDLLNQGYNLDAVYSPYKKLMADTLGIDQNTIDLNDPSLRMAISDKGDMNTYDYQKALRKDTRWQYSQQANAEVADATQQVLKDFGFMG